MSEQPSFNELNNKYQICLNNEYDQFLRGKHVDFENSSCNKYLEELKNHEGFKGFQKEYEDHLKKK